MAIDTNDTKTPWRKGLAHGKAYPIHRRHLSPTARKYRLSLTPLQQKAFDSGVATGKIAQLHL
jgi:hypothetical protein